MLGEWRDIILANNAPCQYSAVFYCKTYSADFVVIVDVSLRYGVSVVILGVAKMYTAF